MSALPIATRSDIDPPVGEARRSLMVLALWSQGFLLVCDRAGALDELRRLEPSVVAVALGLAVAREGARQLTLRKARKRAEREGVSRARGRVDSHLSKAVGLLGISRPALYEPLYRLGLK